MIKFIFNRAFQLGFWVAMSSFVIFNFMTMSANTGESRIRHYRNEIGFPLAFFEWGGDPYVERILPIGLAIDLSVAVIYSLIIGCALSFFWMHDLRKTREAMTEEL